MITPADLKLRYPEFASIADARIQIFIDQAVLELDENRWGDWYNLGLYSLTAHLLTIAERTSSSTGGSIGTFGPVASRSIGDVSVSFGLSGSSDRTSDYYNSTPYGQEFWRLMMLVGIGAVAVTQ